MRTVTWGYPCFICKRPIQRGRPTILFSTSKPEIIGISHSTCAMNKYSFERFQTCPPNYLTEQQISFLTYFFVKLYDLPGGEEPNRELRYLLAYLLRDFPDSLTDITISFKNGLKEYKSWFHEWLYHGDLETDFLRTLGQIQKAAIENPVRFEIDFLL